MSAGFARRISAIDEVKGPARKSGASFIPRVAALGESFNPAQVHTHSRMDERMEAQAKIIDAMGLNEDFAQRFIQ